jgi:hypothetical protein
MSVQDQLDFIRWTLVAVLILQGAFLFLFLRAMSQVTDGFNETIKGLQAMHEELRRLRSERG